MNRIILTLASLFIVGWTMAQTGNHWTPITDNQYNMTVRGIIVIDGETQASSQLEIGAFCGEECRGSRLAALFPPTGEYTVMLTIKSNVFSGETITFRIYDHASQQELNLQSESTLIFEHNTNQGSMGNWFPFVFTTSESMDYHFVDAGLWSNPSNWLNGALPGSTDEVFIDAPCQLDMDAEVASLTVSDGQRLTLQAGRTLTVSGDLVNASIAGLVIENGAQLINASVNVSATMEKDIIAYNTSNPDGWYTIASPMDRMGIAESDFLTPNYDLYRYDETNLTNEEWQNYKANHPDFTTFENGRGNLYANSNSFSPAFTDFLNASAVTRPLTCTERPDALSGFNLIGNPFPHVIYKGNGGAIDNAKLASGYYTLTNEGAWHVHTYDDAIQPGQGILVKTTAATDLTIQKTNAASTSETGNAKANAARLEVSVAGQSGETQAFAYFASGIGLDKMENLAEEAPSLSIRHEGRDYAIAHLGTETETMDLMFSNKQSGDFTLAVGGSAQFNYLHLVDYITGEEVDLSEQPTYTFHANGNEYAARFMLIFKQKTGVDESDSLQQFCFVKDGVIYLYKETQNALFVMTDVLGRTVKSVQLNGNAACPITNLKSGVYLVRLTEGTTSQIQKIVIHP